MSAFTRSMLALVAAVATAASAGSSSTSAAQGGRQSGSAFIDFGQVFADGGFLDAEQDGVPGRNVPLGGAIEGTNFEPGICQPGVDDVLGLHCVVFGDGPGQFTRLAPGGVAFTTCHCTVDGVGNEGDQVILKISYPRGTPPQYLGGFTKFTFQHGTGELSGLHGQGTLDLGTGQIAFNYGFAGN